MPDALPTTCVVVCGSRDWPEDALWFVSQMMVEHIPRGALVITGGARGVDAHAHREAVRLGHPTKVMHADWRPGGVYNPKAGLERNLAMLDQQPSLVLAFHAGRSTGTAHTIRNAWRRQIPCKAYTESALRPDLAALDMGDIE